MRKQIMTLTLAASLFAATAQTNGPVQLTVDASRQIATASRLFNGTNIEDINNQTNGGVFSQLLHGEAFEENIETDFLNLDRADYSKIYVMLDERRIPHLITQSDVYYRVDWNNLEEKYDFHSKDIYNASPFRTPPISSPDIHSTAVFSYSIHCRETFSKRCWNESTEMNRSVNSGQN